VDRSGDEMLQGTVTNKRRKISWEMQTQSPSELWSWRNAMILRRALFCLDQNIIE
jgi:hypothetical protein